MKIFDLETRMKIEKVAYTDEGVILELRNVWFPENPVKISFAGPHDTVGVGDMVSIGVAVEATDEDTG